MTMFTTTIVLIILVSNTISSPVPDKKDQITDAKVLYDQRQEGEWNVRAHLDNFIIMIIPTQSVASSTSPPSLLDFLTKSLPKASYFKRIKHVKKQKPDPVQEETMHFIESKSAPYHVDLSNVDTDVMKTKEDVVLASSPSIALLKPDGASKKRTAREYVFTVPADEEYVLSRHVEPKTAIRKHKKTIKEIAKKRGELKLLGAENEQCGPGMVRDSYGICTVLKY